MKNKIREIRKDRKLTQDELAKKISVSRQTINAIENDRYNPTLELAIELSQELEISIEELFLIKQKEK